MDDDVEVSHPDPTIIEALVRAGLAGMEHQMERIPHTTPAEVISACFTLLDHTLKTMRTLQDPKDRLTNAKAVAKILQEFLVEHGSLPN